MLLGVTRFPRSGGALLLALTMIFAVPASASAVRPTGAELRQARAECWSERGVARAERLEFAAIYGRARPFRKCVRVQARMLARERRLELPVIRGECRLALREAPFEFRQEFPGGIRQCVRLESAP
jgi:hypothetical protein